MSGFRVTRQAERELDDIWLHIARESRNLDTATRLVDSITDRFFTLARFPRMGRPRDADLRFGMRSFAAGDYVVVYRILEDTTVLILRVVHGSRDIAALLRRDVAE